jgi:hypothetical protein
MAYGYFVNIHKIDRILSPLLTTFTVMKSGDSDDQGTADFVLTRHRYQPRLVDNSLSVRMAGM